MSALNVRELPKFVSFRKSEVERWPMAISCMHNDKCAI